MESAHTSTLDSLNDFAAMWDKAMASGAFKDSTPAPQQTTPQASDHSFFGMVDNKKTSIRDADAEYWAAVSKSPFDPCEVMHEMLKGEKVVKEEKQEIPANPVPSWTKGKDQEEQEGETTPAYTDSDFDKLTKLKEQLHDLGSQIAAFPGEGKDKGLMSKLEGLKKQIDDISDVISNTFPKNQQPGK